MALTLNQQVLVWASGQVGKSVELKDALPGDILQYRDDLMTTKTTVEVSVSKTLKAYRPKTQ